MGFSAISQIFPECTHFARDAAHISDTWRRLDQGDLKVLAHAVSGICPSTPVDIYYLFVITRVLKTKSRRTWSRENVNKGKTKESAEPALLNARIVAGTRALDRPSWLPGIPNALATMPETFGVCQQFRLRIWLRLLSLSAARVSVRCHLPHSTLFYSTRLQSAVSCQLSGLAFSPGDCRLIWRGIFERDVYVLVCGRHETKS